MLSRPSLTAYSIAYIDLGVSRLLATSCGIFWFVSAVLFFDMIHDTTLPPRHQDDSRTTKGDNCTTLDGFFSKVIYSLSSCYAASGAESCWLHYGSTNGSSRIVLAPWRSDKRGQYKSIAPWWSHKRNQ